MKKNKILLTGGGIGSLLFASSLFVACSCSNSNKDKPLAGPIALVTDAGDINDQSFNQQAWEALQFIQSGSNPNVDVFKPKNTSAEELYSAYIKAEKAGKKYIFANGYLHQPAIYKYNAEKDKSSDPKDAVDKRLKFFLIDDDYFEKKFGKDGEIAQPNKNTHTNVVSFKYDILPAGHQAGLLIGQYFKTKDQKGKKVGFWGGGPFDAVSDFIKGLLSGIQTFNYKYPDYKLEVINWNGNDKKLMLDSGFEAGKAKNQIDYLLKKSPDVILPVAGPQFRDLIGELNNKNKTNVKIIGVDVDQHKNVSDKDKSKYLTSILKNIKDTFYYANKIFIEKENYTNLWNNKFTGKMLDAQGKPKWGESIYLSSDIGMTGITKLKDLPLFTNDNGLDIDKIWGKVTKEYQFDKIAKEKYQLKENETSGYYHFPWNPDEMADKLIAWINKINSHNNFDFQ